MQSLNFWQIADENLHSNTDHMIGAAVCKSQPGQRQEPMQWHTPQLKSETWC